MIWLLMFLYFLISFCTICYWFTEYYDLQKTYQTRLIDLRSYLETIKNSIEKQALKEHEDYLIDLEKSANSYRNRKQMTFELSPVLIFVAPIILFGIGMVKSFLFILDGVKDLIEVCKKIYRMYEE